MPCAQFEALEQIRQAQCDRGIDSDKMTIKDDNNNDAEDAGDPQGEPALLKTSIRETTLDMFKRVLLFSQGAVEALYNNQMITALDTLQTSLRTSSRISAVPSGSQEGTYLDTKSPSFP
jgi:hypothetical protein